MLTNIFENQQDIEYMVRNVIMVRNKGIVVHNCVEIREKNPLEKWKIELFSL